MKDKHRRRKGRTWADAAKTVLEKQPNTPMNCKEILKSIQKLNLKDISGIVPSACLNAVLHGGSRGPDGIFYKVGEMMGVYGLRSHLPDEVRQMLEFRLDDTLDTSGTQGVAENAGTEMGISKQQSGSKKMLCYLPEKAHSSVPALCRSTLTSASSSSSTVTGHSPMRAVSEVDEHHHHHHHRAKGLKATSQMHSPTKLKFTLHHKHRRKQQIVPRIILKPLKSPPGKEPNYAAEVIDLTPSPSDNELDQQSLPDDTDNDTDTTKDDNAENIQGISDNHTSSPQPVDNTVIPDSQPSVSTNPLRLKDNSTASVHNPTNMDSVVGSVTRSQITRDDKNSSPSLSKSEPQPASRVSQRISMRQALPLQTQTRSQTMSKLMANVPGFSGKPRNREKKFSVISKLHPPKKMSLHVDLETPDSILANVNLKALINKHTFNSLPAHYQYKLLTLLPRVDRVHTNDNFIKMYPTALDNEFFARACSKWRERLSAGEFTPESQQRLRQELDKDRNKLDPWKAKHFEPMWGQSMLATAPEIPESFASMGVIPPEERKAPAMHTRSSTQRKTSCVNSVSTVYRNTRSATSGSHHHYHKLGYESSSRHHRGLSSRESKRMQKHAEKEREHKYRSSSEVKIIPKQEIVAKDSNLRSVIADINVKQSSSSSELSSTQTNFSCSSLLSSMAMESQRHQVAASLATLSSSKLPIMQHKEASPLKRPSESKIDVQEKRLCRNDDAIEVLDSYDESSRPSSTQSSMSLLTAISCSNNSHLQMSQASTVYTPDTKTKLLSSIKSPVNVVKQGHHTRTLAQIKAQTQARVQAHGQTRTLAQIKKQTTAKLLARSVAQAEAQSQAKVTGHVPTILGRPRSQQWNTLKTVIPVSALSTSVSSSGSVIQASPKDTVKQPVQNNVLHVAVTNQQVVQTIPSFYIKAQPGTGAVSVVYVTQPDVVTLVPASAAALQQMNNKSPSPAKQVLTPQTSSSQKAVEMVPQPTDLPISNAANVPQRPKSINSILNMRNATSESQNNNASSNKAKSEDGTGKVLPNGTCLEISNAFEPSLTQSTSKTQSTELNFSVISRGNTAALIENKVGTPTHQPMPTMVLGSQAVPTDTIKLLAKGNVQLDPFSCRPAPSVVLQRVDMTANGRESGDSLDVSPGKCSCRLGAMVICKGCGAFCHDDCISSTSLCMACVVR